MLLSTQLDRAWDAMVKDNEWIDQEWDKIIKEVQPKTLMDPQFEDLSKSMHRRR